MRPRSILMAALAAMVTALGVTPAVAGPPEGLVVQAKQPIAGSYLVALHGGTSASSLASIYGGELQPGWFVDDVRHHRVRDASWQLRHHRDRDGGRQDR